MRIPGWRGMPTDSLSRRIEDVLRNGRDGCHARRRASRRRVDDADIASRSPAPLVAWRMLTTLSADERVMWIVWTWAIVLLVAVCAGDDRPRRNRARRDDAADSAARHALDTAVVDRQRGGGRPTRLRRAHSALPGRGVLLGMVAPSRARLLRSSARRRAAHSIRRRLRHSGRRRRSASDSGRSSPDGSRRSPRSRSRGDLLAATASSRCARRSS